MEKFKPKKTEKEVISIRISSVTLRELDEKAAAAGMSRNELINQMIGYALKNMDEEKK